MKAINKVSFVNGALIISLKGVFLALWSSVRCDHAIILQKCMRPACMVKARYFIEVCFQLIEDSGILFNKIGLGYIIVSYNPC